MGYDHRGGSRHGPAHRRLLRPRGGHDRHAVGDRHRGPDPVPREHRGGRGLRDGQRPDPPPERRQARWRGRDRPRRHARQALRRAPGAVARRTSSRSSSIPLGVPVIAGLPIGHGKHHAAVPIGALATLDAETRARSSWRRWSPPTTEPGPHGGPCLQSCAPLCNAPAPPCEGVRGRGRPGVERRRAATPAEEERDAPAPACPARPGPRGPGPDAGDHPAGPAGVGRGGRRADHPRRDGPGPGGPEPVELRRRGGLRGLHAQLRPAGRTSARISSPCRASPSRGHRPRTTRRGPSRSGPGCSGPTASRQPRRTSLHASSSILDGAETDTGYLGQGYVDGYLDERRDHGGLGPGRGNGGREISSAERAAPPDLRPDPPQAHLGGAHARGDRQLRGRDPFLKNEPRGGDRPLPGDEWKSGEFIRFARNPNDWRRAGRCRRGDHPVFESADTMVQALRPATSTTSAASSPTSSTRSATTRTSRWSRASANGYTRARRSTPAAPRRATAVRRRPCRRRVPRRAGLCDRHSALVEATLGGYGDARVHDHPAIPHPLARPARERPGRSTWRSLPEARRGRYVLDGDKRPRQGRQARSTSA